MIILTGIALRRMHMRFHPAGRYPLHGHGFPAGKVYRHAHHYQTHYGDPCDPAVSLLSLCQESRCPCFQILIFHIHPLSPCFVHPVFYNLCFMLSGSRMHYGMLLIKIASGKECFPLHSDSLYSPLGIHFE